MTVATPAPFLEPNWVRAIDGVARRCETASRFGASMTLTPDAAAGLALLLRGMAQSLDERMTAQQCHR